MFATLYGTHNKDTWGHKAFTKRNLQGILHFARHLQSIQDLPKGTWKAHERHMKDTWQFPLKMLHDEIHRFEKLKFLGIAQYKFKLRCWCISTCTENFEFLAGVSLESVKHPQYGHPHGIRHLRTGTCKEYYTLQKGTWNNTELPQGQKARERQTELIIRAIAGHQADARHKALAKRNLQERWGARVETHFQEI